MTLPIEQLTKKLYQWALGDRTGPLIGQLFCTAQTAPGPAAASLEEILEKRKDSRELMRTGLMDAIGQMIELGVEHFRIIGGIHSDLEVEFLEKVVGKMKDGGGRITLISKGMALSNNEMKGLIDSGVGHFEFTLMGPDEDTHYDQRDRDGSWENNIRSLELICSIEESGNRNRPSVSINTVLTRYNWNRLANTIRLAHRYGADYFQLHFTDDVIAARPEMSITTGQARELLLIKDDLINLCRIYNLENNLGTVIRERDIFRNPAAKRVETGGERSSAVITDIVRRFRKRFPDMEESFIRFATLRTFEYWFLLAFGPEGIYVPDREKITPMPFGESTVEEIWFGDALNERRSGLRSRKSEGDGTRFSVLHNGTRRRIQKGLFKRWRDAYRLQPDKTATDKDLLAGYRKKEINVKVEMLDRDIQLLERELQGIKRRMEIYSKDRARIDALKRTRTFKVYRALKQVL